MTHLRHAWLWGYLATIPPPSSPLRHDAFGWRGGRRRGRDRYLDDFDRFPISFYHVIVAVEQARNHLCERARIGCVGRCIEGNCAAVSNVESCGKRRKNIGDRIPAGGDANRRRDAFDMDFGASRRREAAY